MHEVLSLDRAREQRQRTPRTVVLSATLGDVHRQVGVNDALTLAELHIILDTCFGFSQGTEEAPWRFSHSAATNAPRIDPQDCIHRHLGEGDSELFYSWGLWVVRIELIDVFVRDAGTPQALCTGGTGELPGRTFDPTAINATLMGDATIQRVLANTHPEAVDLIKRTGAYDFVPLLQAMGLERSVPEDPIDLPVEQDRLARDAFFAVILGLSCMSDQELTDAVIENLMQQAGWATTDASAARRACARSLEELARLGGIGRAQRSAVERIEIYRRLLSAR